MSYRLKTPAVFIVLLLEGCAGVQYSLDAGDAVSVVPRNTGMAGRWILAAPNAPACGMIFTTTNGERQGGVTPDGGCPERFFMSRRWTLSDGTLTINEPDGEALGQFKLAEGGFEGKSAAGTPVTLTRTVILTAD